MINKMWQIDSLIILVKRETFLHVKGLIRATKRVEDNFSTLIFIPRNVINTMQL